MTSRILSLICLIAVSITLFHCGGGDDPKPEPEPTEKERVTALLTGGTGTWAPNGASGITVDGVDVTEDLFDGFSIKFAATTFTTTGTSPVWLRSDTWSFTDDTATKFTRGQDGKQVTIVSVTETELKLSLVWDQTTYEGGRGKSIGGTHVFTLKK